jgi:hypothetical protein
MESNFRQTKEVTWASWEVACHCSKIKNPPLYVNACVAALRFSHECDSPITRAAVFITCEPHDVWGSTLSSSWQLSGNCLCRREHSRIMSHTSSTVGTLWPGAWPPRLLALRTQTVAWRDVTAGLCVREVVQRTLHVNREHHDSRHSARWAVPKISGRFEVHEV